MKIYILILFCVFLSTTLLGQEVSVTNNDLDNIKNKSDYEGADVLLTIQEGSNNQVFIEQVGANAVFSQVSGNSNIINSFQEGRDNAIYIFQNGKSNQIESHVSGVGNEHRLIQKGTDNYIEQNYVDLFSTDFTISQDGNNLEVIHSSLGASGKGIDIKMTGNDMKIFIETFQ